MSGRLSRQAAVAAAAEGVWRRACDPELALSSASLESRKALQASAWHAKQLLGPEGLQQVRATELLEAVASLALRCLELAQEAGLAELLVAELLCEGLAAAALLFAEEEEEASADDRGLDRLKHEHRAGVARFLEPLGEALDAGAALEISESLRRLEVVLQPRWQLAGGGRGGCVVLGGEAEAVDVQLYDALTGVCAWTMELLVRAVGGHRNFSASALWEFVSEDIFSALVFAKGTLCFQQGEWEASCDQRVPEDLPELRDAVLAAVLGLGSQDLAFGGCDDAEGASIGIAARNEQLFLHRATLAAAASECALMDCLLAYPWATGLTGAERLPAFVSFLTDTVACRVDLPRWSNFLISLAEQVEAWTQQLLAHGPELWSLLAPLALTKRGFLRDCAALAHVAPPDPEACNEFLVTCLSEPGSGGLTAALADPYALAALVVLATNAGCQPGSEILTGVLVHLDGQVSAKVVGLLQSWHGPVRGEALQPWLHFLTELSAPGDVQLRAEDIEQEPLPPEMAAAQPGLLLESLAAAPSLRGLRDLVGDAPPEFRCALDGRLLVDPVRAPSGQVFERSVLARALASGALAFDSDASREQWALERCPRDVELRKRIVAWIRQRPRQRAA